MEHTKGKWHACCLSGKPHFVFADEDKTICGLFSNEPDTPGYELMEGIVTMEERRGNAKLIAAAPELLESCIEAEKHHQGYHSEIGAKLRSAIKKATE